MNKIFEVLKSIKLGEGINKILGGSLLAVIGAIVGWYFTDREKSLTEMNAYDKYITDVIVLNDHPAKKRMLAQYFASVTPSFFQNDNWDDYLCLVEKDYYDFKIQDSLDRLRFKVLLDKSLLTNGEKWEKDVLETKLKTLIKKQNEDVVIPNNSSDKSFKIYIQYEKGAFERAKNVKNSLDSLNYKVEPLDEVENILESDIRFFSDTHLLEAKGIAQILLEKHGLKLKEKNFKVLAKNGISNSLEIWIAE